MPACKSRIDVSPEMLSFVGPGALPPGSWPEDCVVFGFAGADGSAQPVVWLEHGVLGPAQPAAGQPDPDRYAAADLVLVVQRAACHRIFGLLPDADGA